MKVSIITVSYNSERTIEKTIQSVISQDYNTIEYIIIDGKSTDNTIEICKKYANKISIIISEKDNGIYDAMNKGIALASGDIIGILNSDDWYANDHVISDVVNEILKTKADALYGDLIYVNEKNLTKAKRYWKSGKFKKNKFKFGWMPPHPTVFIKKVLYEKFGTFNLTLKSAADYELMLRFFFKNNIIPCYLPKVITIMRLGGKSNATISNRVKANQEDRIAWKINNLKPNLFTLSLKPIRKIPQFLSRKQIK